MTDPDLPLWEQRLRAPRVSLPEWALDAPDRCLYTANPTGTFELFGWDRATGEHRQLTARDQGTGDGALSPDGAWVWWFDDTDGDEYGVWRRQRWEHTAGGPADEVVPGVDGVPAAYSAGLALGQRVTAVGCADDDGCTVWVQDAPGSQARVLYRSVHDADVADLSRDETLLALEHSEHGDSRHRAVRVVDLAGAAGSTAGELWDGPGLGLHVLGFAPEAGDPRVLLLHERRGRPEPLLWDPTTGAEDDLGARCALPGGDLDAQWWPASPDGAALLLHAEERGRSTLHRLDLATGAVTVVPTPAGSVTDATARPGGVAWFAWSDAATPTAVLTTDGEGPAAVLLSPPPPACPGSVPVTDVHAEGPGGTVHALLAVPPGAGPWPTVVLVHGGPTWHDSDAFAADRAAYVDLGCAVVQVNYRGSTGYGAAWRDALTGRPGLTELEDVAAVVDALVADGVADPARLVLTGGSWGGYLTLLGLGTQPERWCAGVAAVPVADYVTAYQDEMEPLKAFDRSLFGGSPEEVPEVYARCSPLTYADRVRAPLLVLAGENDPRCPIRQVDVYLDRLAALGTPCEVYRFDAGHGSLVVDERVRQLRVELAFVARALGLPDPG